eukprot:jgi/Botrbrau1/4902/Bobra.118_1s0016.1
MDHEFSLTRGPDTTDRVSATAGCVVRRVHGFKAKEQILSWEPAKRSSQAAFCCSTPSIKIQRRHWCHGRPSGTGFTTTGIAPLCPCVAQIEFMVI